MDKMEQTSEGNMRRIDLRKENTADQCRWREGVGIVVEVVRCIQSLPFTGDI